MTAVALGEHLCLHHQRELSLLCSSLGSPFSEYSFANLYLFRKEHLYKFVAEDSPHIVGVTYDGERFAMPLARLTVDVAHSLLSSAGCLYPVGPEGVEIANRLGLECDWNEDDADYIYEATRLAALSGAKQKRAQAAAFAELELPHALPLQPKNLHLAHEILEGWLKDVGKNAADTDYENCREALALKADLGLDGSVVCTSKGECASFLLAGPSSDGGRIVHFAKGRRKYAGAYPWMFANYAARCGSLLLNFEQDLGKPGFAQAKRALAPIGRLRKYRLRRRRSSERSTD